MTTRTTGSMPAQAAVMVVWMMKPVLVQHLLLMALGPPPEGWSRHPFALRPLRPVEPSGRLLQRQGRADWPRAAKALLVCFLFVWYSA